MADYLPPHILQHFTTHEIPFAPPLQKLTHEKVSHNYSGVGAYLKEFEISEEVTTPSDVIESAKQIKNRLKEELEEKKAYEMEQKIAAWDSKSRENITKDPFKTLFVGRINYDTKESKLKKEFEIYGPIEQICLVQNSLNGKPRGYAFIEYKHEKDMVRAFEQARGKKIDGRRVLVDVERGRTVDDWLPRKFGGGLGGRQGEAVNCKNELEDDSNRERRIRHSARNRGGSRRCSRSRSRRRSRSRSKDRRRGSKNRQIDENCRLDRNDRDRRHKRRRSRSIERRHKREC